jgi:hypothetical protein
MKREEKAILELITEEWESLSERFKPMAGVWIRQYAPMPLELDEVNDQTMFPHAVWFLDETGLRQESIWKWRRFLVIHWQQPWCSRVGKEPSGIFGHPHEIGLTAFAPYLESDRFYVEMQWGGRFGSGWQVVVNDYGRAQRKLKTWVS